MHEAVSQESIKCLEGWENAGSASQHVHELKQSITLMNLRELVGVLQEYAHKSHCERVRM